MNASSALHVLLEHKGICVSRLEDNASFGCTQVSWLDIGALYWANDITLPNYFNNGLETEGFKQTLQFCCRC